MEFIPALLESPYAGDVERNVIYARLAMRDMLLRGEAPFASHLLYTQEGVLDDDDQDERAMGIEAGLIWGGAAKHSAFYTDFGMSRGMRYGAERARAENRPLFFREVLCEPCRPYLIERAKAGLWINTVIEYPDGEAPHDTCRACGGRKQ